MPMFCYQCEQTGKGTGCTQHGVCGKDPEVAALQDLLVEAVKGIARYAHCARQQGAKDPAIDGFALEALFATLTNVNFDAARFQTYLGQAAAIHDEAKALCAAACQKAGKTCADLGAPVRNAADATIQKRIAALGDTLTGLQELIVYGVKGAAAYAYHARVLGKQDDAFYALLYQILDFVAANPTDVNALVGNALKTGELNLKAMELLDAANTSTYGHPEPTQVRVTPIKGKAILVSGHDIKDLEELLKQTEGKGINVYTHGEMLPTHAYPALKRYKHLAANYGSAWQNQQSEFDDFPGAIVMTTNCLMKPRDGYKARVFTCGPVGFSGVAQVQGHDFAPAIAAALAAPGFPADAPDQKITIGFARNTVMSVAGAVIDAVKSGAIKHFFLIGGCDGAKPGRNYYTELAEAVPKDCVILTLACGKYRFNKLDFGDIGGIPRLLDVGQCNDAYSAVQIALALAGAFNTDVNSLPLSIICSWYEQKAVAILLTLLHLGIKNIRLGPSLPAFVTPPVLKVLVDTFNIAPITTPSADLKAILG